MSATSRFYEDWGAGTPSHIDSDIALDKYYASSSPAIRRPRVDCSRCSLALFALPLVVTLSMLVSFGLALLFVPVGSSILQHLHPDSDATARAYTFTGISSSFARVVACGCAVVDGALFVVALGVAWLVNTCAGLGSALRTRTREEAGRGIDNGTGRDRDRAMATFLAVEICGTVVASAFMAAVGVAVLPDGDAVVVVQAVKAGCVGLAAVAGPVALLAGVFYVGCLRRTAQVV